MKPSIASRVPWEILGIAVTTLFMLACAVSWASDSAALWTSLLGTLSCLFSIGIISIIWWKQSTAISHLHRQTDILAHLSEEQIETEDFENLFPEVSNSGEWSSTFQSIFNRIAELSEMMSDVEQVRARSEVRAHLASMRFDQMREIVDSLTEPVLMVNQFEEIVISNENAKNLFGLPADNESQHMEEAISCEPLVQLIHETRKRKSASQRVAEIELVDSEDEKHWYQVTCCTVDQKSKSGQQDNHQMFGAVAILRDISGYKAIQKRNAEFVSSVSHEMKTPLAGIKAYVELLADGEAEDEETQEEFLSIINGQADRLQRLIDNLLNLARIEAGVVNVNKKPRSLNEVLEEAASLVLPTAEQKQITLVQDLSPMYLGVLVDRDMILQGAINLLSNALKYTPEGGRVTLRSRLNDREVTFEVEDTGVGLSKEDCEMVFEKFYRVKKDQKMASGTGLGLPLAKHIVEDVHGGSLTVTSEVDKGSTFKISLPTVQVTESAV
ncbi:MAG: sensor histidine kinase [Pirellulales bacterium]